MHALISTVLAFLGLLFFVASFLGLIKPSWTWRLGRPTRPRAFFGNLGFSILCVVLSGWMATVAVDLQLEPENPHQASESGQEQVDIATAANDTVNSASVSPAGARANGVNNGLALFGAIGVLAIVSIGVTIAYFKSRSRYNGFYKKYSGIADVDAEKEKLTQQVATVEPIISVPVSHH